MPFRNTHRSTGLLAMLVCMLPFAMGQDGGFCNTGAGPSLNPALVTCDCTYQRTRLLPRSSNQGTVRPEGSEFPNPPTLNGRISSDIRPDCETYLYFNVSAEYVLFPTDMDGTFECLRLDPDTGDETLVESYPLEFVNEEPKKLLAFIRVVNVPECFDAALEAEGRPFDPVVWRYRLTRGEATYDHQIHYTLGGHYTKFERWDNECRGCTETAFEAKNDWNHDIEVSLKGRYGDNNVLLLAPRGAIQSTGVFHLQPGYYTVRAKAASGPQAGEQFYGGNMVFIGCDKRPSWEFVDGRYVRSDGVAIDVP